MSGRFEQLRERLLRAGIAPRHVRRYIAELRDHFDDLVREETANGLPRHAAEDAARTRIGSDDTLAKTMLGRPELRSVSARFPWAVFGFAPVLILISSVVAVVFLEIGLLKAHLYWTQYWTQAVPPAPPEWMKDSVLVLNLFVNYAAPLLIAALLCALGIRQRLSPFWIILGAAIVCILGGFHEVSATWPAVWPAVPSALGHGELDVGFALAPPYPQNMIIAGLIRAAVNLVLVAAACGLWLRRGRIATTVR